MSTMLYIFDDIDLMEDDFTDNMIPLLSEERFKKMQRLRSVQGKKASVVVYLLLRIALFENYDINENVGFIYKDKGKPVLKDYPDIHFSLSHSHNTAACVVADFETGVDVQKITKVSDRVAERVLTNDEYAGFLSSNEPDSYFCEVWTIKESFLKKTGQGITAELRNISAASVPDKIIYRGKEYFCCVCGPSIKASQKIDIKHIGREDFGKLLI